MRIRDWLCSSLSRRAEALELEDEALALWLTARDGLVNIGIIICLFHIVEVWQGSDFYFDNAAVKSLLTKRMFEPNNMTTIEEERQIGLLLPDYTGIATLSMVWDWLHACILPVFAAPAPRVLVSNRLLGKVRLRQVRVRSGTCSVREIFDSAFAECYGPYTRDNENRGKFGTQSGPTASAWEWSSARSLGGGDFLGEVETYGGGGFYADLPRDHDQAVVLLQELRDGRWLDEATRMLFVDINLYNPDSNVFVLVNLYIEIPPTAGLLPRSLVNTLKLLQDEHCQVTSHVMLLVLSLWTGLMQAAELAACGWWAYAKGIAHDMHLLATVWGVVVSLVGIVRNCRALDPDSDRGLAALRSHEFVDLLTERYSYDRHRYAFILLLFLSCGRLLFLSDFGRHSKLTSTLYRSLPNMLSFSFMFAILMCSFSMLAYLVFGTDLYVFRTFGNSLFVLVEVITGQLDYQSLATTNRFLGPLFYMAFIFFVVFVLYNMFIVILNDTYHSVREEAAEAQEVEMYEVVPFLKHCLQNLLAWLPLPVALPQRRQPPRKVVQMRTLRTLLLDYKVPREAVADFMWQVSRTGGNRHVDKEQAAQLATAASAGTWKEPASWEHFRTLWQRLREVERCAPLLDTALDGLLEDLR